MAGQNIGIIFLLIFSGFLTQQIFGNLNLTKEEYKVNKQNLKLIDKLKPIKVTTPIVNQSKVKINFEDENSNSNLAGPPKKIGDPWSLKGLRTWAMCNACGLFFDYTATLIRKWKRSLKSIQRNLSRICPMLSTFSSEANAGGPEVCVGLIEHFAPTVYYIIQNSPQLQGNGFCGFVLQQFGCDYTDPYLDWSVNLNLTNLNFPENVTNSDGDFEIGGSTNVTSELIGKDNVTILDSDRENEGRLFKRQLDFGEPIKVNSTKKRREFKILHLSDLHVDLQYQLGAVSVCREKVICCRAHSTKPQKIESPFSGEAKGKGEEPVERAGLFGDGNACGSPMTFLQSTLEHITKAHPDIQMIYMGGDLVPHDVHGSTIQGNSEVTEKVTNMIQQYFPSTPIIPVLGNHDTHPVNFFSPPGVPSAVDTRWIYNMTLHLWKNWIPANSSSTYMKEGYYSREMPGNLKIIALNTNMCYGFNFWGLYEVNDPGDQLAWLIQELDNAEKKGQSVHIVGHVPPGSPDCNKVWSRNFYKILSRYHGIIKGQFYGHLHKDTLKLFYSSGEPSVPINAAFISPAFTPYKSKNPSYKIFYADGDFSGRGWSQNGEESKETLPPTWDILDYELYIFDLNGANQIAQDTLTIIPRSFLNEKMMQSHWFRLYRATLAYEIEDTRPQNLAILVNKLAKDKSLFDLFYQHYEKALIHQREVTSFEMQKEILCDIVRPYAQNDVECDELTRVIDQFLPSDLIFQFTK